MISLLIVAIVALGTYNAWQFAMTGYWKLREAQFPDGDILGTAHHARIKRLHNRYLSVWMIPVGVTALIFTLTDEWYWAGFDIHGMLRPLVLTATGIVTWRAITMDVDLVAGRTYTAQRFLMGLAWLGIWFHAAFVVPLIFIGVTWLRSNYHHQHLALRTMIMFAACLGGHSITQQVGPELGLATTSDATAPVLFMMLCVCASHYFVPGIAKLKLGPRWYSWMLENRLHAISISAYLWGWLRFLPEAKVISFVKRIRPFDRVFQVTTLLLEVGAVLMLFNQTSCLVLLTAYAVFHMSVAALSGIFFWQYIVVDLLLAWTVWTLPESVADSLFGVPQGLVAATILITFPRKARVWAPFKLAWWDTTFACRVCYEVSGQSGSRYGLYNNFMCPNERIFGQTYGDCISSDLRISGHIGETSRYECFKAINAAGQDVGALRTAKTDYGKSVYCAEREAVHDEHLKTFIHNFNAGHRKRVVPLWMKAPGGQLFYWGALPSFTGQEPIAKLNIVYREYYFDGVRVTVVTDRHIKTLTWHEVSLSTAADEANCERTKAA